MAPPNKRRKLAPGQVEDLTFDPAARQEYLSGFHKRKQARIQHARDSAVKREREERIRERRLIREQRKDEIQQRVQAVNAELKKQNRLIDGGSQDSLTDDEDDAGGSDCVDIHDEVTAHEHLEHEEEYVDEDKHTTVTVEPMDYDQRSDIEEETAADTYVESIKLPVEPTTKSRRPRSKIDRVGVKSKKKKFRYESKADRAATRKKQKSRNQVAKARRQGKHD